MNETKTATMARRDNNFIIADDFLFKVATYIHIYLPMYMQAL